MENRFLFVIDTSSAMKARAKGVEEAVNGLLESGIKGELRKGDTIGLWTYSDRLNTDFPMELWSDAKKDDIIKEVSEHLSHLRYEKRSHLEKAMPAIQEVVDHSERLTIIFIFDGTDLIKGTSFDKDINGLHKRYASEFRSAHAPFVTILSARKGAFFDYTINYPGTVMVPHTADPLPPPETNAPPVLAVSAPPPVEQPASAPVPPTPLPTTTSNIEIIISASDFTHNKSAPPAASNFVAIVTPAPVPAPVVVTSAPPPAVAASILGLAAQTNVASAEPERTPPPVASTPPSAPTAATLEKSAPVAPSPPPLSAASSPVTPAAKTPVAPAVGIPVAPTVVAATTGQLAAMFIMALSLLTIAVVLVLFLVRRSRGGPQPSLISQSIDRSR
jgi:hypothetical protein